MNNDISSIEKMKLSEHPTWHKLLFYESSGTLSQQTKSAVLTDDFFLSKNGRFDPKSELLATLNAFMQPEGEVADAHAQCVFRGRFLWLKQKLAWTEKDLTFQKCTEYEAWSSNGSITSISVVLASGYLGNPASYYGHLLIKMNLQGTELKTKLEDVSINYGAIVPDNEGPIAYIAKGLFGGYDAGFSNIQFYFHNHNYGENENRDLWEYELDLSYDETQLIVAHTWEVMKHTYTYYFLDKNCAYRLADLLEIIEGINLLPDNPLWVMPQSLIQKLNAFSRKGKPLVKSTVYLPSRQSRLYHGYSNLDEQGRDSVKKIAYDINTLEESDFLDAGVTSKQEIVDVLLDYYQYARNPDLLEKDINNSHYRKVLATRYQLPPGKPTTIFSPENMPHMGRNPSMFNIGVLHNDALGYGYSLRIRPTYYDTLDYDYGHVKNAQLSMADLKLTLFDNRVYLRSFDIVNIDSVNNYATGLPGDTGNSWKLKFGLVRQNLSCEKCIIFRAQGDMGKTVSFSNGIVSGAYIGGAIHNNKNSEGNIFLRASAFLNIAYGDKNRLRVEMEQRTYLDSPVDNHFNGSVRWRYKLSKNSDIRLGYERNRVNELSTSMSFYW